MCNVGFLDRFLRLFLGTILLVVGGFNGFLIPVIIGAIFILTGSLGFCPLYKIFGSITTCNTSNS